MRLKMGLVAAAMLSISMYGQTPAGLLAHGTARVQDTRGAESGTVTVQALGRDHCKVTFDFSTPGNARVWTAVLDGKRSQVTAPQELARAIVRPDWTRGCVLLPQGAVVGPSAAAGAPQLALEPGAALVRSLTWKGAEGLVVVGYSGYRSSGGMSYPGTVTESVGGVARLTVHFTSVTADSALTLSDFALRPPPAPATHGYPHGGGQ